MPLLNSLKRLFVPTHVEPTADRSQANVADGPALGQHVRLDAGQTKQKAQGQFDDDRFVRPQMAVSQLHAELNTDQSGVLVNQAARPTPTLDAAEILSSPHDGQRAELLLRYQGFLGLFAGGAVGKTSADRPADVELQRGDAKLALHGDQLSIEARGHKVELDVSRGLSYEDVDRSLPLAMLCFDQLLFDDRGVDPKAAEVYLWAAGPDGLLSRGPAEALPKGQLFETPKLVAWDFNGTVEKFGDGRTRGNMAQTARTLGRRGAQNVITTTISPEGPEKYMLETRVGFEAYFGKDEVRPTKGNKQYAGICLAHGISADEAPARFAVVGDSRTDVPADLPGAVFFHNSATTPAPAIELLLKLFDERGGGSIHKGLVEVLGGLPAMPVGDDAPEQRVADFGHLRFSVEMRNGGDDDAPCWVPTVHQVELLHDVETLSTSIAKVPPQNDLTARAAWHLAVEHLVDGFDEGQVPALLDQHPRDRSLGVVTAAVDRRLEHRGAELEAGREAIEKLPEDLLKPLPLDAVAETFDSLIALGDSGVAERLQTVAADLERLTNLGEGKTLAELSDFAGSVKELAARAMHTALPLYAGAAGQTKTARVLEAALDNPVPLSSKQQEKILALLEKTIEKPSPGVEPVLRALLENVDEALEAAKTEASKRFGERREIIGAIGEFVARAPDVATRREAAFADIVDARKRAG